MSKMKRSRISVFDNSNLSDASRRNEKRSKRRRIVTIAVSGLLIVAALFLIVTVFCRVAVIEVSGTEAYSDAKIIEVSGIKYGSQLFGIKKSEVSEAIRRTLPGIESAKISFSLPNKVKITLSEGDPRYSFVTGGKIYYLSENFVALGSELTVSETDRIYMIGPEQVKRYIAGEKAVMYDDDWYYIIEGIVTALEECGLADKVTLIETTDKFNITVRYDGRMKILLGEYENIPEKLEFAKSTINSFDVDTVGTIRVKNYKIGSFLRGEY